MVDAFYKIISSKKSDIGSLDPAWAKWFRENCKCSVCWRVSPEWSRGGKPLDVVALELPTACWGILGFEATVWRSELIELLGPAIAEAGGVLGTCEVRPAPGQMRSDARYQSLYCRIADATDLQRGRYCRHRACAGCGRLYPDNDWARGGVLRRDVAGRSLVMDCSDKIYVSDSLRIELQKKCALPDLRFRLVPILDEPLDGDVLPGDERWDGVFRQQLRPTVPHEPDAMDVDRYFKLSHGKVVGAIPKLPGVE